jgi:hypothetical protein
MASDSDEKLKESTTAARKESARKEARRKFLFDNFGSKYYTLMFLSPEKLGQDILNSDEVFELLLLGITYPMMQTLETGSAPPDTDYKHDIQGLVNLVSEMTKLIKDPKYQAAPEVSKLKFLGHIKVLTQLKERLEESNLNI